MAAHAVGAYGLTGNSVWRDPHNLTWSVVGRVGDRARLLLFSEGSQTKVPQLDGSFSTRQVRVGPSARNFGCAARLRFAS